MSPLVDEGCVAGSGEGGADGDAGGGEVRAGGGECDAVCVEGLSRHPRPLLWSRPWSFRPEAIARYRLEDKGLSTIAGGHNEGNIQSIVLRILVDPQSRGLNYSSKSVRGKHWAVRDVVASKVETRLTGFVKMTVASHLHYLSKVMPVKDHCEMLSQQFLRSTTQANHPNHGDTPFQIWQHDPSTQHRWKNGHNQL